jgi:DeoR/GlpR family transcriptional regulator of sugar metabolism
VALIDASKIGRASMITIASAREFDAVVVDAGVAGRDVAELTAAGVKLEVAPAVAQEDD